jgi:hypothetical protein
MGIDIGLEVSKLGSSHTIPVKTLFGGGVIVWLAAYGTKFSTSQVITRTYLLCREN